MELKVHNIEGQETGRTIVLSDDIFASKINEQLVHLDVIRHLAAKRQGTHKTKTKNEIKGSTRKLRKQKGGGTARVGSIKSPLFRGGGTIFGPKPHKYDLTINKKASKLARKSVLTDKAQKGAIIILESFSFEAPKTKNILAISKAFGLDNKKKLFLTSEDINKNIYLSSRNLKDTWVLDSKDAYTYAILNASVVLLTENAITELETVLL